MEARRTPRLRSPGIRLTFGWDCFREENQKAKQISQANPDPMIRSWEKLRIRLQTCFTPYILMIYPPPADMEQPNR